MNTQKIISWVLKIPLYCLVLGSFFISIYAAFNKIEGVTWKTPLTFGIILICYLFGLFLGKTKNQEDNDVYL